MLETASVRAINVTLWLWKVFFRVRRQP